MSLVTYSRDERLALAALLDQTGPDAPTLCAGWQTRDLGGARGAQGAPPGRGSRA